MKKLNTLFFVLLLSSALMAQTVTSVTPNSGHQGATLTLTIVCTGMNFNSAFPYAVTFNYDGSSPGYCTFNSSNPTVVNATTLSASLTIPTGYSSFLGTYDVVVTNQQTSAQATGVKLFTVAGPNGIVDIGATGFHASPIPAIGLLNIDAGPQQQLSEIVLTTLDGQVVLRQEASGDSHETLDIHAISAGIYILSVSDRTGAVSNKKIIVE